MLSILPTWFINAFIGIIININMCILASKVCQGLKLPSYGQLIFCTLVDWSFYYDPINLGKSIVYIKGCQVIV